MDKSICCNTFSSTGAASDESKNTVARPYLYTKSIVIYVTLQWCTYFFYHWVNRLFWIDSKISLRHLKANFYSMLNRKWRNHWYNSVSYQPDFIKNNLLQFLMPAAWLYGWSINYLASHCLYNNTILLQQSGRNVLSTE